MAAGSRWGRTSTPTTRQARDPDVEGLLPPPARPAVRPPDPGAACPGPGLVATGARGQPAVDPGRGRFARATGDYDRFAPDIGRAYRRSGCPTTSTSRRSLATSCAGGSSVARSAWRPAPRPARPSPTCTRRCTTSRANGWRRRAGCVVSPRVRDRGATDDPEGPPARRALLAGGRPVAAGLVSKPAGRPRRYALGSPDGRARRAGAPQPRRGSQPENPRRVDFLSAILPADRLPPCEREPRNRRLHDRPTLAPRVRRSSSSCANVSTIASAAPVPAASRASFEE